MKLCHGVCSIVVASALASWAGDPSTENSIESAIRSYDLTAATVALSKARDAMAAGPSDHLAEVHARASLAVAELIRIDFENLPPGHSEQRRDLGQRIDATALEGLTMADLLPVSSERERIKADLLATMIRSDFRAKKYENEFKSAVSRALELDENNPRAWVTAAKPLLFAPPDRGKDLVQAIGHLDHALRLDPKLESALLLRAFAKEESGDPEAAMVDWQTALDLNPHCRPAERALAAIHEEIRNN